MKLSHTTLLFLGAAALGGCASRQPPPELVDARTAFARARTGETAQANPAGVYEAKRALDAAERKEEDDPGSSEARSLAYIAHRRVLLAEANGRAAIAQQQAQQAEQQFVRGQGSQLAQARGQLDQSRERMRSQEQRLAAEQKARAEAEQRAKDALQRLSSFANVKSDPRGMVITLSGSVLFATNKSEVMGPARERLNQVGEALKEVEGRHIRVLGYTDSVGKDEYNQQLSQKRAEAVRAHLISRGVREDMVVAEGRGEEDPVASNASPEGRANNRRVEIVVEGEQGVSPRGGMQQGDMPQGDMPRPSSTPQGGGR
jgi:outer membrane protein OmpA-like peptidoglycan-associated protein